MSYEKDKRTRLTIRLTDKQFEAIKKRTDLLGISPSEFIRILINTMIYADENKQADEVAIAMEATRRYQEGLGRENDKATDDD